VIVILAAQDHTLDPAAHAQLLALLLAQLLAQLLAILAVATKQRACQLNFEACFHWIDGVVSR